MCYNGEKMTKIIFSLFSLKGVCMRESILQARLIIKIKKKIPGCIVLKNDPNYLQGFPDIIILFEDKYAVLEVKDDEYADRQPNQEYYISLLARHVYANFVYPENEERVLHELQEAFRITG